MIKAIFILFMAIMTFIALFGKHLGLSRIRPFYYRIFSATNARFAFRATGSLFILASIIYIVILIVFLLKICNLI